LANHKSELKRIGQNLARRERNRIIKTRLKNAVKTVRTIMEGESVVPTDASAALIQAQSLIDTAAKKGVIHKRTAARKVSRLSRLVSKSA